MRKNQKWAILLIAAITGCAAIKQIGSKVGTVNGVPVDRITDTAVDLANSQNISKAEADKIGRSVSVSITNTYKLSTNADLTRYVRLVGLTLADSSDGAGNQFIFGVLEDDAPGAYSAPGGYIFVSTGLLKLLHNEAELAGVLAHELTHVNDEDGLSAVKRSSAMSILVKAGAEQMNITQAMPILDGASDTVLKTGYDRPAEFSADAGAVKLLIAAGYDPHGFQNFLARLDKLQSAPKGGGLMSTHPATHDRLAAVTKQIADAGSPRGATLADRFKAAMPFAVAN